MSLSNLLTRVLPTINRSQQCPECGEAFACEIRLQGCWCREVKLSASTLEALRGKYKSCLCRLCLEKAETKYSGENQQVVDEVEKNFKGYTNMETIS
jgi:hypothetical protein